MTDAEGRLCLRYRDGEAAFRGQLEDYAVYVLALLELYQVDLQKEYLTEAVRRAGQMRQFFEDAREGRSEEHTSELQSQR